MPLIGITTKDPVGLPDDASATDRSETLQDPCVTQVAMMVLEDISRQQDKKTRLVIS